MTLSYSIRFTIDKFELDSFLKPLEYNYPEGNSLWGAATEYQ